MSDKNVGSCFRSLVMRPAGVFAFGIYDALSARVAQMAGFECIYAGGYSAAGSRCLPDMGLLTRTQMLEHLKFISEAVDVPVVADIDDGYGGILNVEKTTEDVLTLKSIAAIHIEDQPHPKRCGHISGKTVVPVDEFLGKLKMAVAVRQQVSPDKLIIARTDAFSAAGGKKDPLVGGDIDEALRRGRAYADAGADLVWSEFPSSSHLSAQAFAEGMRKTHPEIPLAFNVSLSFSCDDWKNSELNEKWLNQVGYKYRFATYPALVAAAAAVYSTAKSFIDTDPINSLQALKSQVAGSPTEIINKIIDVARYLDKERRFDPRANQAQANSEGYKG